jgi:hypothetical protein
MEKMRLQSGATRRTFLKGALAASAPLLAGAITPAAKNEMMAATRASGDSNDRTRWIEIVERVSHPVLKACSEQRLRATMPVEAAEGLREARMQSAHLEAVGRLLTGLAPWLEAAPGNDATEETLRSRYREWARLAIRYGTDPHPPDAFNFGTNPQSLVDTAFLAQAIVRAPNQLWAKLDDATKGNVVRALRATHSVQPGFNNWLLFCAMIEACLCKIGEPWDAVRVDYALREHQQWYVGDGMYGDGPQFHWDYYNSFVIQPMLLNVLDAVDAATDRWRPMRPPTLERARRYAAIQERLISPEGTFPAIGRSLAYRFGALQLLAEMALRRELPEGVHPAQVRAALTAVMTRMIAAKGTFDDQGWLTIGFAGHQPALGEAYISTGSCYLCSAAWLPLGLAATDLFWSAPARSWTAQKIWGGENVGTDHALSENALTKRVVDQP